MGNNNDKDTEHHGRNYNKDNDHNHLKHNYDIKKIDKISFEDFAWEYIKMHVRLHLKGKRNQEYIIKRLILEFKGRRLDQIDPIMIRQYVARRLEGVRPSTVNRWLQTIKSMFSRAIEWGMLHGVNPAAGIKNVPQNNSRCRWLTEEEGKSRSDARVRSSLPS